MKSAFNKDFIDFRETIEHYYIALRYLQIVLDDRSILQHVKTTQEIKECCKDIKVLGRKDLKTLLHWLKQMKEWKASLVSFAGYFDTYV